VTRTPTPEARSSAIDGSGTTAGAVTLTLPVDVKVDVGLTSEARLDVRIRSPLPVALANIPVPDVTLKGAVRIVVLACVIGSMTGGDETAVASSVPSKMLALPKSKVTRPLSSDPVPFGTAACTTRSNRKSPVPMALIMGCVLMPLISMFGKGERNAIVPLLSSGKVIVPAVAAVGHARHKTIARALAMGFPRMRASDEVYLVFTRIPPVFGTVRTRTVAAATH
jgi:hypothetical protein